MSNLKALRWAILASFVLLLAVIFVSFWEGFTEARDQSEKVEPPVSVVAITVELASLLGIAVGSAAMIVRKRWGAWLHLCCNAAGIGAGLFTGPKVNSAALDAIDTLLMLSFGLVYGIAFFSDALAMGKQVTEPPQLNPSDASSHAKPT